MKRNFLSIVTILAITIAFTSCKKKADEANTGEAEAAVVAESTSKKYTVNVADSKIEWKGFKPTESHSGTISVDSGTFTTNDGNLASGTFLIDMKSITVLDLEGKSKESLESHLKGTVEGKEDHFFNVNKFPSAAFEVTGTTAGEAGKTNLSGNLTIRGVKHNVTFPVTITNTGDDMTIVSDAFTIDRTKWNVNYGSKSVFDNLGDKFINDDMEIKFTLKAKKS